MVKTQGMSLAFHWQDNEQMVTLIIVFCSCLLTRSEAYVGGCLIVSRFACYRTIGWQKVWLGWGRAIVPTKGSIHWATARGFPNGLGETHHLLKEIFPVHLEASNLPSFLPTPPRPAAIIRRRRLPELVE
ncbi:hypothetical protein GGR56DRAFT_524140 [Xylariaceae sp. FL0804]|nr:hypothetical protein GGR56DRAFT_524140 [Xylariaceae sp. FL0804]